MYPKLYRKKILAGLCVGLALLALGLRLSGGDEAARRLRARTRAALGSEALIRAALFLETGMLPESAVPETAAPAEPTAAPSAGPEAAQAAALETEAAPTEAAPPATEPVPISFDPQEAEAIGFRGNCTYEVDKAALLLRPLDWGDEPGPKVLILHSHSCEAYTQSEGHTYLPSANYRTLDLQCSVVAVGDALAEALAELGVEVIHDRTYNDYPSYNASYATAREKIAAWLEEFPSIVMVLDLHRDALEQPVRETVERDGQTLAPLMLVVGTNQGGLNHPDWADNLSCALKLQALGNRDQPSLFKRLSFRKERFNGDMTPGSLIVEVGSTENTLEEAMAAMPYLAAYVEELLRCP